jgi:hypothetical protein
LLEQISDLEHPPQHQKGKCFAEMLLRGLPPHHHFLDPVQISLDPAAEFWNTEALNVCIEQVAHARVPHKRATPAPAMAHRIALFSLSISFRSVDFFTAQERNVCFRQHWSMSRLSQTHSFKSSRKRGEKGVVVCQCSLAEFWDNQPLSHSKNVESIGVVLG